MQVGAGTANLVAGAVDGDARADRAGQDFVVSRQTDVKPADHVPTFQKTVMSPQTFTKLLPFALNTLGGREARGEVPCALALPKYRSSCPRKGG
jgi:hypothetical protein